MKIIVLSYSLNSMQYVIMTVGKTHSGKTTFGGELKKKLKHCCLIDSDVIAEFLKDNYGDLYATEYNRKNNELAQGFYLKKAVFQGVFTHAVQSTLPVVLTNANSTKAIRKEASGVAHKARRKTIMVYFNWPLEILLDRIHTTSRSKKCLTKSANFKDLLLNRQSACFEAPSPKEADIFLEITDDKSWKDAQKTILALLKEVAS
ncbi:MAG: AAA family ATPase [candidate division SR1 bacterium]|nr:AAA family ATPase [candidate division SR1 bacterium]